MQSNTHTPANIPKNQALSVIANMNDTATFDDIMHEVYVLQKIERGQRDVAEGRVYSHEAMRKEMDS